MVNDTKTRQGQTRGEGMLGVQDEENGEDKKKRWRALSI
jgi:hypothetical protein